MFCFVFDRNLSAAAEHQDSVVHDDNSNNEDKNKDDNENFYRFSLTRRSNLVNPKPEVAFALSATRKAWTRRYDWIRGPIPCEEDLEIIIRDPKRKWRTPLFKRIAHRRKIALKKLIGRRLKDLVFANEIIHVPILRGELANEEVGGDIRGG